MRETSAALVTRWIARVWSILSILAVIVFAVGEFGTNTGPRPTPQEWGGLLLFPIGVAVGLILAWYREALGAILSLGCLVGFYVWNLLRSGHLPQGPFFLLLAAPALIFLVAALLAHHTVNVKPVS